MKTIKKIFKSSLPNTVTTPIQAVFGVAIAIAISRLNSYEEPHLYIYIAFGSIIISLLFGIFSIFVPVFIKNNTCLYTFLLWVIICTAFSYSSFTISQSSGYSLGVAIAILALFFLILYYFFNESFWLLFNNYGNNDIEEDSAKLIFKAFLFFQIIVSIISFFTLPIVNSVVDDPLLSIKTGTAFHLVVFSTWFLLTAYYSFTIASF